MKIQNLAVVFIIIIMPIVIVFSEYINNQIDTVKTEKSYDAKLLDSTYDTVKAYQLNTINNAISDKPESLKKEIEAAANLFLTSIANNFQFTGYNKEVINEYIPAVVFTLYDGYYVYSPYVNVLTNVDTDSVDEEYADGLTLHGLKPYVYYSCRYTTGLDDFTIIYSLDNYITIEGTINNKYIYDYGYLLTGIEKISDERYKYDGVEFSSNTYEKMSEYLGNQKYYYVKIDGTKFYYSDNGTTNDNKDDYIFYINNYGKETKQINKREGNEEVFDVYYKAIFENNSGFQYYKRAYEFTERVLNEYGLSRLKVNNAKTFEPSSFETDNFDIFYFDNTTPIQYSDSNFNRHRREIIKKVVETNLAASIAGFKKYANPNDQTIEYIMPKISDINWDLIQNNECVISFLQGMPIGGKVYNGYSVVPNNINKEYVDENSIYILKKDNTYCKVNDSSLTNDNIYKKDDLEYYPGVFNINTVRRQDYRNNESGEYYYPLSYINEGKITPYYASYSSIIGSSSVVDTSRIDMYKYLREGIKKKNGNGIETTITVQDEVKKAYYIALGRERMSTYNVNNSLKDKYREYVLKNGITLINAEYLEDYIPEGLKP